MFLAASLLAIGFAQPGALDLRSIAEKVRDKRDVPALAAGIVHGDKRVTAVAGVRRRGSDAKVAADDQWHLGSNTKPMTALLLAMLIDLGLVAWDTPLEQIFPDLAKDWAAELKTITPAMLLTHTSGLPANWPLGWWLIASKGTAAEQRLVMMKTLGKLKLKLEPQRKYEYSNLGYTVLGAVIDRIGKAPWEEQVEKKIFRPLRIHTGGFGPPGKAGALEQPWPHKKNGEPTLKLVDNPEIINSAGRAHMSAADYCRFLAETLRLARGEKGLLKPATAKKLFTRPYPESPHSLSGWGTSKKGTGLVLAHDGSNTFNYCTAVLFPEENLAVCVFTNQAGDAGKRACVELRKLLVQRAKR